MMKKFLILLAVFFFYSCGGNNSSSPPPENHMQEVVEQAIKSEGTYTSTVNLGTWTNTITYRYGSINANGFSYYKFTTTSSGVYSITTFFAQSRLYWTIYLPGQGSLLLCEPDLYLVTSCSSPNLAANTTYHIAVIEADNVAGYFWIGINKL